MANGEELKEYRQKILQALINDKVLCELVLNETVSSVDDADMQDRLTEHHIYNYAFVPSSQDEQKTYITFELAGMITSGWDSPYKNMNLSVFVFTHYGLIKHSSGNLRTDLIDERVQELLNDNVNFGIGKMVCVSDGYLNVNNNYYGRQLGFKVKDLNRSLC